MVLHGPIDVLVNFHRIKVPQEEYQISLVFSSRLVVENERQENNFFLFTNFLCLIRTKKKSD
jgi:hypothetical protein